MSTECRREADVLDALVSERWPARCEAELVDHVRECAICTDVVRVAQAIREFRDVPEPPLPSGAIVWWRAEMRARREAAVIVRRPFTVVHGLALACVIGLLAAVIGPLLPVFGGWLAWFAGVGQSVRGVPVGSTAAQFVTPIGLAGWLGLAAAVIVTPMVVYLAFRE